MKGIINVGSTCYLNTAIQCLFNCDFFRNFILTHTFNKSPHPALFKALTDLFNSLLQTQSTHPANPYRLIEEVHNAMGKLIEVKEQNDINEFLSLLVDKLNSSIAKRVTMPSKTDLFIAGDYKVNSAYDRMRFKMDYAWISSHHKEYSPLIDLLYGQTISQIECGHCKKIHHNYETFSSLSLAIPKDKPSITTAFNEHFAPHILNDADTDKWKCDKCNQSASSTQCSKIWRLPRVFMINFKRFHEDLKKNHATIAIPRVLDMSPWTLSEESTSIYKLKAVAFHIGSFFGGHYFAHIISDGGKAYHIDDETIHNISVEDFEKHLQHGYVFFYEREN